MSASAPSLTSRDVYQCLRDAALGVSVLTLCDRRPGVVAVKIEGWHLSLACDCESLAHCLSALSPEGSSASLDDWHRYGTDPVSLLSNWERTQLERLLADA